MGFERGQYDPVNGIRNTTDFPAIPVNEDAAREQFQRLFDQIMDKLNELMTALENEDSGSSGAENIGSKSIVGMADGEVAITNLWGQIKWLYDTLDTIQSGMITPSMLADGAVTTAKLADGAVTADKMNSGLLESLALQDNAVTSSKLATGAVTAAKLAAGAVTNDKIASASVTDSRLATGAVTAGKLANGAVTADKLGTGAVTNSKLDTGAVSNSKLDTGAVSNTKLAALAVTSTKLADGAVTSTKLADGVVTNTKLADGAVTASKMGLVNTITLDTNDSTNRDNFDKLVYKEETDQLKLYVNGCTGVQLCPILFGSSSTPPSGTYPIGTIYVQYEA